MPGEQTVVGSDVSAADYDESLTIVRAIATIGLVIATAGLALVPLGVERFHDGSPVGQPMITLYTDLVVRPSLDAWWLAIGTLGWLGLCTVLFFGCLGTVLLKPWGRLMLLGWAVASLGMAGLGGIFYFRWLIAPWRGEVGEVRGDVDSLLTFYVWALSAAIAVGVLIFFNTRSVRAYFSQPDDSR